jgi:hypothetical protein
MSRGSEVPRHKRRLSEAQMSAFYIACGEPDCEIEERPRSSKTSKRANPKVAKHDHAPAKEVIFLQCDRKIE